MPTVKKYSGNAKQFREEVGDKFKEALEKNVPPSEFFENFYKELNPDFRLYSWQKRFLNSCFDMNRTQKRIAVAAGNAMGKTWAACLFLLSSALVSGHFGPMKARITTPTGQASNSSIIETIRRMILSFGLEDYFPYVRAGMIHWADDPHGLIAQIYVMAIPAESKRFDSIRGLHLTGGNLIMVYDECSRFPDQMWSENEGNMANPDGGHVTWLAISNPRESVGGFVRCFFEWKDVWERFQVDMEEINADVGGGFDEHIRNCKILYGGENSPEYLCYIKSQFTLGDDSSLFTQSFLTSLRDVAVDPLAMSMERPVMGVDVSTGIGRASSSICVRKRSGIVYWERNKLCLEQLTGWIVAKFSEYGPYTVCIDAGGYGQAVYESVVSALSKKGYSGVRGTVIPMHTAGRAENSALYKNKRAESIARLAEWLYSAPRADFDGPMIGALCELREIPDAQRKDFISKDAMSASQETKDMLDALLYTFPSIDSTHSALGKRPSVKRTYDLNRDFRV